MDANWPYTLFSSFITSAAKLRYPQVFMLFSIVAKWMTKPVPKIKNIASQIMAQYPDVESPIVSLHIRRVDKMQEGQQFKAFDLRQNDSWIRSLLRTTEYLCKPLMSLFKFIC